jgi:hypothetical protein
MQENIEREGEKKLQTSEHKNTTIYLPDFGFQTNLCLFGGVPKDQVSFNPFLTQVITKIKLESPSLFSIERPKFLQSASQLEGSC